MTNGVDELVNGAGALLPESDGESRSGLETIDLGPMPAPDPTRRRRRKKSHSSGSAYKNPAVYIPIRYSATFYGLVLTEQCQYRYRPDVERCTTNITARHQPTQPNVIDYRIRTDKVVLPSPIPYRCSYYHST